jgi:hypothetical protein
MLEQHFIRYPFVYPFGIEAISSGEINDGCGKFFSNDAMPRFLINSDTGKIPHLLI